MGRATNAIRRCAVYTRKSSEEGLDQDFNSLMHSERPARLSSRASRARAGNSSKQHTMTVVSQAGIWSGPHCSAY
jgi:hypothetical protein